MEYKKINRISHDGCATNRQTIKRLENRWSQLIGRLEAKKQSLEMRNNLRKGYKILIYSGPTHKYY